MRPEDERPEAPRCESCGRFMQAEGRGDWVVVYRCCGMTRTRFRPQFRKPREMIGEVNR